MLTEHFISYGDAIAAALAWLRERGIHVDQPFESRLSGFGMRTYDQSAGYRIEFDSRSGAHINVWCRHEKGPHYVFPGNEKAVQATHRQLFWWDPNLVRR